MRISIIKSLLILATVSACGPLSPTVKIEGETEHRIDTTHTIQGDVSILAVTRLETECSKITNPTSKQDCLDSVSRVADLLIEALSVQEAYNEAQ